MRRKAEADLIPHLVRLAAAAVEEAKKVAEAAGMLTSLAEAAALQAAHGASSISLIHEQTTPTEKPTSLSSLYQATQALQEQAWSRQPTTSAAEAAGTLAKLARAESHEGKEATPLARGAIRPEHRQVLAGAAEAVGCLANMAANSVANQDAIGAEGALPTLVALLSEVDPLLEMAAEAARALCNLAINHAANRAEIVAVGGIAPLVPSPGWPSTCTSEPQLGPAWGRAHPSHAHPSHANPPLGQKARASTDPPAHEQVALLRAGSSVEAARHALCALRNLGHERAVCEALTRLYHDQRRERAAAAATVALAAVRKPLQPLPQPLAGTPEKPRPSGKQRRWPAAAPLPPAEAAAAAAAAQVQANEQAAVAAACNEQCKPRAPVVPPPPPSDSAGAAAIVKVRRQRQAHGGRPCRAVTYRGMIGK
jgi:hypothetical protein